MRIFIVVTTVLLLVFSNLAPQAQTPAKKIAILPFYDESGYRGPWKLSVELPTMLGDMIIDEYFDVVSMDKVLETIGPPPKKGLITKFLGLFSNNKDKQKVFTDTEIQNISRELGADYAVTGIVDEFSFGRWGGGEPMIGGYKSYSADVRIKQIRVMDVNTGQILGTVSGEKKLNSRGLGLELFGKPRQLDEEFYSLDSLDFGSKRYLGTMLGQATVEALNNARKELTGVFSMPDSQYFADKRYTILNHDGPGIVNINAGSADGIKAGDQFWVYASDSGAMVGKINVTMVWADHISKAEIVSGKDAIRDEDYILPVR